MLRFDLPRVPANVIRWEALLIHIVVWLALFISPWFLLLSAFQGFVKGFFGHHRCPSHLMWRKLFEAHSWGGHLEDVGAKMFAAKLLFLASIVGLALFLSGSSLWRVPTIALLIFSFLEWALSFCAACWVYSMWYQIFPPKK